ncbi:acyltransferase family protein [Streptosporangium sp. NBC_01756]|uniref:acyltransferase family protein n=1 Tax=Streptosporangium sp. NBC_01756 TaxID=2975950 RepID=UPI002DDC1455|nr:acyltransferase family protein [Streptosporangium sp. NBC_01756]WSC86723.1 acyltransferase family protein [Streptosporangium sp. NBC_01756]
MENAPHHNDREGLQRADTTSAVLPGTSPSQSTASRPRLWFVDNLRILLISLVVLHHTAATYSGIPAWYYTEKPTSGVVALGLTVFLLVNQAWFMGAFFLLSGYFTPGAYDRKGPRAFLRDRLIRLGVPLVVFYFLLNPILYAGFYGSGSPLDFYLHTIGSGPLWFVLALLVLDGSYAALRLATRKRPARSRTPQPPTYPMVIGFVLVLALTTYVLRIAIPVGFTVPVIGFPSSAYLPQYVSFFVLGTVAYRRGWFHAITARMGRVGLGMAIGATLVFLPLALAGRWEGHGTLSSLCYALWDSTFAVGIVLALLTCFRRRLDTQGPLRRYLSAHVFTVYVIHAFVVTAAGYALSVLDLPTLVKFAIAAVVVLPVCFTLAGPIRRLPGVRHVL